MPFVCRTYLVPTAAEDDVVAELWRLGTLGVSVEPVSADEIRLRAYFSSPPSESASLPSDVRLEAEGLFADRDWLELFRHQAAPFPLGDRFLVDPGEPRAGNLPSAPGRRLLQLPARAAFGTGSHESTALAVEVLETIPVSGARVLDVGTGTGVLALAALALGAQSAVAFDLDLASPFHARDNARRNGLSLALFAGTLAAIGPSRFDLALANLIAEQLLPELEALLGLVRPSGAVILSGILVERSAMLLEEARRLGFMVVGQCRRGEWVALYLAEEGHAA